MSTSESDALSVSVEVLAEEFLERKRRGERPTLAEYAARYPERADEIREFFPVLGLVEDYKPGSGDVTGSLLGGVSPGDGTPLERLGDFRMLREVGRGGMGVVYEAEQESLGRRVALKVLAGHRALDPKLLLRFHREAKAAARLHHTNIVPVFGVGEAEGLHFYVMQFIQGLGLDQVLDELRRLPAPAMKDSSPSSTGGGDLTAAGVARSLVTGAFTATWLHDGDPTTTTPPTARREDSGSSSVTLPGQGDLSSATDSARQYIRSVVRIGLQVAEALEYAHEQGTLHRDIKPSNLLLDAHGTVWVTDFGLAKVTSDSDLTHTGDIVGTIRYMAPERFAGHCDARADVYALGLTLYELLTKRPAFETGDRNALIRDVTQTEPKRLRALDRSIPRDLETIVHKAIEKDPAHRYASAAALGEDLRRFLEDRPIAARRIGRAEQLARWARRNPGIAGLTALVFGLLVVLALGATLAALRIQRSEQRALVAARRAEVAAAGATREAQRATGALASESAARKDVEAANASLRATRDDLRRIAYAARMSLVQAAFESGDVTRVASWLDQTRPGPGEPDLRGFEWHYWSRQLNNERSSRRFFTIATPVETVLSGDGTRVTNVRAVAHNRVDLVVTEIATQRPLFTRSITGTAGNRAEFMHALALNRDGTRLAAYRSWIGGRGGDVRTRRSLPNRLTVWDVDSGRTLLAVDEDPGVDRTAVYPELSPDGTRVARILYKRDLGLPPSPVHVPEVAAWDVATGRRLLKAATTTGGARSRPAFTADGSRMGMITMASTAPEAALRATVHEWDLSTGRERTLGPAWVQETLGESGLAYSPDGARLAVVRPAQPTGGASAITLLDAATGAEQATLTAPARYSTPAWSPDGRMLALRSGGHPLVQLLDAAHGRLLPVLRGHAFGPNAVVFRPDGATLVSIDVGGTLKEWDVSPAGLEPVATVPLARDVTAAALSDDGARVARAEADATANRLTIVVQEVPGGRELGRVRVPRPEGSPSRSRVVMSPRGLAVAVYEEPGSSGSSNDGVWKCRLTLADPARGRLVSLGEAELGGTLGPNYRGLQVFRPDGQALALGIFRAAPTNEVQVRDAGDGRVLARWEVPGIECLAFRADGRALAGSLVEEREGLYRARIAVWDARDGRVLHDLEGDATPFVVLAFSPDGTRLAAGRERARNLLHKAGEILVWDLDRPRNAPLRLVGLPPNATRLAFSDDGRRIVAAGSSQAVRSLGCLVRLWDATSGQELLSLSRDGARPEGVAFRDGGRQFVALLVSDTYPRDARAVLWDARPLPPAIEAGRLIERHASGLESLDLMRAEVRAAVAAEPNVSDDVRAAALAQADAWPEYRLSLLERAQKIAGEPGRPAAELCQALACAEAAVASVPDEEEGLYTRGLARLRLGQVAAARDDLETSARSGNDPATWGLLALAEIRLGHRAAAEAALGMMTRRAARDGFAPGREIAADLRRQAETLILEPIFPADPFVPQR
jgi:serine/threonine protein kinase/WD40 repeat protein